MYSNHTTEEVLRDIKKAVKEHKPFSINSLGDAELIFLCHPAVRPIKNPNLYMELNGVNETMTDLKAKMIELLPENDYVWVHKLEKKDIDPMVAKSDWAIFFYVWDELFEKYNLKMRAVQDLMNKYRAVVDGRLFEAIKGSKVLLVGSQAPKAFENFKNKKWLKHYEKMGFNKAEIVGYVSCPEKDSVGYEVDNMLEEMKKIDFDVALIAIGASSAYICPMIKRMGKIAIDIGHTMNGFAGTADPNRPLMNNFDYDR